MDNPDKILKLKEELTLLKEKLKISQSLVKVGFWEYNRLDKQIFLSDEALNILKLDKNKPTISLPEFAEILSDNQRSDIFGKINNIENDSEGLDIEYALKPANNENEVWIKIIANTKVRSKKNPNIIIGILQDISEQKNNEKLLKKAKDRAEEADILKSAFLANMSHEIRTPLNAILGFSQLLTNPDIPNKQRNEYSEYITSSANNLLNLIRDIVDVSKIEAGKILIEKSNCQVNKILNELKFTFEKEKENKSKTHIEIRLKEAVGDKNFSIITDPYRFHQILVNLIGNALKFIENGYIEFGYELANPDKLQFYVKDTGIGIPEDKLDLIFSRFGQIIDNKIKNPGGTGLGLSITKHLVERLGGEIWLDSEVDVGTTFYFTLPYIKSEKIEGHENNSIKSQKDKDFKHIKILAVEDDMINMILLEDTLKIHTNNISIVKAFNGKEAIEKLKENTFDLIIMDIRMPLMDGYEATSKIRNEFTFPKNNIPIIGLSAHALKEEIEKGKQIGMNDFLSKPILPDELISKIKSLLTETKCLPQIELKNEWVEPVKDDFKIMDLIVLEKIFNKNTEKLKSTLKVYLEQIPNQLKLLDEACSKNDENKLKNISHSLKSTFRYLGRNDLSEIARNMELELNLNKDKELIMYKLEEIACQWKTIEQSIKKEYFQT